MLLAGSDQTSQPILASPNGVAPPHFTSMALKCDESRRLAFVLLRNRPAAAGSCQVVTISQRVRSLTSLTELLTLIRHADALLVDTR